ncbi:MAG: GntR family transcriptional regulator [Candidatus Aminicenantes bacterium]|nr:MAG: GntR family transcriptional regulator [Candidatus Aminicenantes bacterium]
MKMAEKGILNVKSLKEQVYEYLQDQLAKGELRPGSSINMDETSQRLGVSRTPLRDALLQLEMEGFVSILPRRGVVVNQLTLKDIKNYYEIIGALESIALLANFDRVKETQIQKMHTLNTEMKQAIEKDDFNLYYQINLQFHNIFLDLCKNKNLVQIVKTLKKRLYDFPRQEGFVKQWEQASIHEHLELVKLIEEGKKERAANYIRDVHWSYLVQEKFLKKYYKHATIAPEEKD